MPDLPPAVCHREGFQLFLQIIIIIMMKMMMMMMMMMMMTMMIIMINDDHDNERDEPKGRLLRGYPHLAPEH